jgi:hypothetical protein
MVRARFCDAAELKMLVISSQEPCDNDAVSDSYNLSMPPCQCMVDAWTVDIRLTGLQLGDCCFGGLSLPNTIAPPAQGETTDDSCDPGRVRA